jgi:hypothetical protein
VVPAKLAVYPPAKMTDNAAGTPLQLAVPEALVVA